MKINNLTIESGHGGGTAVVVWATCHCVDDVDDVIAWLNLAKAMMRGWEKIDAKRKEDGA